MTAKTLPTWEWPVKRFSIRSPEDTRTPNRHGTPEELRRGEAIVGIEIHAEALALSKECDISYEEAIEILGGIPALLRTQAL